jgi:7-keto-8-aminopelargonate synthetase-like enzyme
MPSESHIVPVLAGGPERCKAISDELLLRFGIYVQPCGDPLLGYIIIKAQSQYFPDLAHRFVQN